MNGNKILPAINNALTVAGLGMVAAAIYANRLGIDQNSDWGPSRRFLLVAGSLLVLGAHRSTVFQVWCYFYQKDELTLQSEDWEEVVRLGKQALSRKLTPNDPVEWIPLLQAYAYLGHEEYLVQRGRNITDDPFLRDQACRTFEKMAEAEYVLSPTMVALTNELYCD